MRFDLFQRRLIVLVFFVGLDFARFAGAALLIAPLFAGIKPAFSTCRTQ
jgi:hypothetical protein